MARHSATFVRIDDPDASPGPIRTRADQAEGGIARIRRVPSALSESPRRLGHRARVARGRMLTHAA
jgi:hypothetical protein